MPRPVRPLPKGWPAAALAIALSLNAPATGQESGTGETAAAGSTLPATLDPGAPEGATLTARVDRRFDRYALPVGPYSREGPDARELEGRVIRSAWRIDKSEATTASVMDAYRERLDALGYEILFRCRTEECGGFDFRFGIELLPPPAMLLDVADFAQLSARREGGPAGPTHVSVLASRVFGAVHVQTVAVAAAEPAAALAPAPTVAASEPGQELPTGAELPLLERLTGFGHVQLQSIDFEPGSAALTAGSAASLDVAAKALAARPELSVMVVGHSDNEGSLESNIALSRRRAEAVREALVARGIDAARLDARGAGFLAPVASNASEEGRALNRRVELVLR